MRCRFLGDFLVNLDDILITELLVQTTFHRAEFTGAAPDHSMAKLIQQVLMNLQDG